MALSHRVERIAEQIREELSQMLSTEVRDPGVGLVTVTRVKVTADLSLARVYWTVLGESKWLLNDTNFSTQVREIKKANPDILSIAAHPFTTCGLLKEMERQGVKPKLIVGLTSTSSQETMQGCPKQAEGMIIPSSFAPVSKEAKFASEQTAKKKGAADLHSMAAWENVFILKEVMENAKISGKKDAASVQADRRKIRDGLAALKTTKGLLGTNKRTADREADKPYVFVHAKGGNWQVLYNPL